MRPYGVGGPDVGIVVGLGVLFCAAWLAAGPFGDFPLNDDWTYGLAARSILETGRFTLPSPSSSNVVAQAYWGASFCLPFGFSYDALRVSSLVLAVLAIGCTFLTVRELGGDRGFAAVAALGLGLNPVFFELSATFMTDVPFLAVVSLSLWLYVRGSVRDDGGLVLAGIGVALVAVFVRQFALALPVAFAASQVSRRGFGLRSLVVAVAPVLVAVGLHLAFERWMVATGRTPLLPVPLSALVPASPGAAVMRMIGVVLDWLPYFGMFLAPVLALSWSSLRGIWGRGPALVACAAAAGVLVAMLLVTGKSLPRFGNILTPWGVGPLTLRDTWLLHANEPVLPEAGRAAWLVATGVGVWGTVLLLVVVIGLVPGMLRSLVAVGRVVAWPDVLMLGFVAVYLAGILLLSTLYAVFDRYLLVPILPLSCLLLRWRQLGGVGGRSRVLPAVLLLVGWGGYSVASTHDYFAWNRARWRATALLQGAGHGAQEIDGGYEFNGLLLHDTGFRSRPGKSYWWVIDDVFMIASGPLPGFTEVGRIAVDRWFPVGPNAVVTLRRAAP